MEIEVGEILDKGLLRKEYYYDMVDRYLGSEIEELVFKYYESSIDIDEEYEDLISYITDYLLTKLNYDYNSFRKTIGYLKKHPSLGRLLVSYIVSNYIDDRDRSSSPI